MPASVAAAARESSKPAARVPPATAPPVTRASSPAVPALSTAPPAMRLNDGKPLDWRMRRRMEKSFGANLGGVRVHGGAGAGAAADRMGAKAFAVGSDIVLGARGRADDLGLMAHETAHTIQQGSNRTVQRFSRGGGDAHESEARRASAAVVLGQRFAVIGRTGGPRVQGDWLDLPDPLDWIARKANIIPGFRMFTIILGVNPINMSSVDSSPANILRALIEIMPGGGLITEALDNSGVFEKVAAWGVQQVKTLGLVGSAIKDAVTSFIAQTKLTELVTNPGGVWERGKRIFTEPIDRIKSFAEGLVDGIIQFVKDAILKPLAVLASKTNGWDLLCAVLGTNPITGESVSPSPDLLIGGFMKLIGQEEVWARIQKTGAIGRCWAWFQSTMKELVSFVKQIPKLAIDAFKALELWDIVLVPRALIKVGAVFANFLGDFFSWAGSAMWKLLEIVFDVVSPGAWGYIKKTGAALKSILQNPLPFVGNLVKAAKLGFQRFSGRFLEHLKRGLIDWLTGSLPGVYIPKAISLPEVGKFALSVLGITWAQIRAKLVKALGPNGEKIMAGLEGLFDVVVALKDGGPAAAWKVIQDKLTGLKDQVISGITGMVVEIVVTKAIPKLIAMFIPGAGFISAIVSIYDTIMVFVNKISKIIQVVTGFINSIVAIANGVIDAAAAKVESVLAGLLSLAISFLAGFAGMGKVADKVMGVVKKVQATVDKALDAAITWIISKAKALFGKLFGAVTGANDTPEQKQKRVRDGATAAVAAVSKYSGKKVGAIILKPLLALVQIRYRLTKLEPVRQGEEWYVRAEINPVEIKKTGVKAGKDVAEVKIIYEAHWPLDEFRSKAGAIKRAAEGKPVSSAKTLPIDLSTGKQQSTHGARKGGQAAFRNEIHAFIDRVADVNDQKTARGLMDGLQADHQQELQMSGTDDPANMAMIESRMNSQLGAMFRGQLKDLSDEATLEKVDVDEKDAKPGQHRESGKARELETLLLKHAGALQTAPATVKSWFKL
jgi:hypothetical protein